MNTKPDDMLVTVEDAAPIALICLDNPPVNAAGFGLRRQLAAALQRVEDDPRIKAVALYGAGRGFIAGADIREFGKPPQRPTLPELCDQLEAMVTPVVALIHGMALGGGLEVALGAHARIAIAGAKIGFPEVTLGLLPGAGGTQRAPRLIGIAAALELIISGRPVDAATAHKMGLVDGLAEGDPRMAAKAAAGDILSGVLVTRRSGDLTVKEDEAAIKRACQALLTSGRAPLFAPQKCIEAVAASTGSLVEGLALERRLFGECLKNPQSAGLIHAFFAQRAVANIPEAGISARPLGQLAVIGGGTMGSGIATSMLIAGFRVTLVERDAEALARATAMIGSNLAGAVKRGKMTAEGREAALETALTPATDLNAIAEADLIIEAVFEDLAVKTELFQRLDKIAKAGAILATNTSYLNVDTIAAVTGRRQDVLGLHFFSPAHIMRLLEVAVATHSASDTVATGFALGRRLGKVAVRTGLCDGYIGNRILSHYLKAVDYMMLDGASPQQIDRALEAYGFAMGPFAVSDLAGLDIGWAERRRQEPTRPANERYVAICDRICERGWFGRKTGQGYYLYGEGGMRPNPAVAGIIAAERAANGITPRDFSDEEIVARYMTAMIAEATRVVADGIALRPIDIDAVLLFGYGFPRHRGGPMHQADCMGSQEWVRRLKTYAAEDAYFWQTPPLLAAMARDGKKFSALNSGEITAAGR